MEDGFIGSPNEEAHIQDVTKTFLSIVDAGMRFK